MAAAQEAKSSLKLKAKTPPKKKKTDKRKRDSPKRKHPKARPPQKKKKINKGTLESFGFLKKPKK